MRYYILFNLFLILFGCLLPWLLPGLFVVSLRGIDMIDGKVILVLAAVGFLGISYQLIQKKTGFDWLYGMIGLATLVVSGMDLFTFYQNRYPIGPGIYLVALGGLQLVGSYVMILFKGGNKGH